MKFDDIDSVVANSRGTSILFAIYDKISSTYNPPVSFASTAVAVRFFNDFCKRDSFISAHLSDFELHCLGLWNSFTGELVGLDKPEIVASAPLE